jgi:hypothetical protein
VKWVKLPVQWVNRLRASRIGAASFKLAHVILIENFKLEQMAVKEIVLSKEVTGQSRRVRQRAIRNLVKLGLIRVKRIDGKAIRVSELYYL